MPNDGNYDVAVIGAGIVGTAVAYELANYRIKVAVIEKNDDVAKGTTRANSAVIHAGYDPPVGTLMAKTNVRGSLLWKQLAARHNIDYKTVGSLVIAKTESELRVIEKLYKQGIANGVEELRLLTRSETLKIEPNITKEVAGALLAGTAAIINPWQACIALAEFASRNGADFLFGSPVAEIGFHDNCYYIAAGDKPITAKYIVNAAGNNAGDIHNLAGGNGFGSYAVRGEYYVLDKKQGTHVKRIIFPAPGPEGKGVLVAPTVHGNLIAGPTADTTQDKDDTSTTSKGQDTVREYASRIVENLDFSDNIRNFAGNRAYIGSEDFLVAESSHLKGFINMAGVKSPGLSSAPALAELAAEILAGCGLDLIKKERLTPYAYPKRFAEMSEPEQLEKIKKDPRYGRVVCRCETVTEAEIVNALASRLTPSTVAALKRRVNAGLGRCQGGFCSVRIHEIIARERNLDWKQVTMDGGESYIVTDETKTGTRDES